MKRKHEENSSKDSRDAAKSPVLEPVEVPAEDSVNAPTQSDENSNPVSHDTAPHGKRTKKSKETVPPIYETHADLPPCTEATDAPATASEWIQIDKWIGSLSEFCSHVADRDGEHASYTFWLNYDVHDQIKSMLLRCLRKHATKSELHAVINDYDYATHTFAHKWPWLDTVHSEFFPEASSPETATVNSETVTPVSVTLTSTAFGFTRSVSAPAVLSSGHIQDACESAAVESDSKNEVLESKHESFSDEGVDPQTTEVTFLPTEEDDTDEVFAKGPPIDSEPEEEFTDIVPVSGGPPSTSNEEFKITAWMNKLSKYTDYEFSAGGKRSNRIAQLLLACIRREITKSELFAQMAALNVATKGIVHKWPWRDVVCSEYVV